MRLLVAVAMVIGVCYGAVRLGLWMDRMLWPGQDPEQEEP